MRVDDRLCRHDLNDEEWQRLLPMMPTDARRGRRWSDYRMVINGILFRTRTGCPWRDVPGEYGHWKTAYNRHRRRSLDGTWQKILGRLRAGCDEVEGPDWTLSAASTVVRAHPARHRDGRQGVLVRGQPRLPAQARDHRGHPGQGGPEETPPQPRPGRRPPAFNPARYKERNTVERCFAKLRQFRAVATRYDKRD